jgi:hypothetical protein
MKKIIVMIMLLGVQSALGMDVPQTGSLIQAAQQGDVRQVRDLLAQGADVNAMDQSGKTALMIAAGKGDLGMVNVLLKAPGIDLNRKDKGALGLTALMSAALKNNLSVVKALVQAGADPYVKTKDDSTALTFAQAHKEKNPALIAFFIDSAEVRRAGARDFLYAVALKGDADMVKKLLTVIPAATERAIQQNGSFDQTMITFWANNQMLLVNERIQKVRSNLPDRIQRPPDNVKADLKGKYRTIRRLLDPKNAESQQELRQQLEANIQRIIAEGRLKAALEQVGK